jgi:serine/threonine protein kinase
VAVTAEAAALGRARVGEPGRALLQRRFAAAFALIMVGAQLMGTVGIVLQEPAEHLWQPWFAAYQLQTALPLVTWLILRRGRRSTAAALTADNALTGTPHYMSPESLTAPEEVDARGDLYALGAVGYFLLTAEHVFPGATTVEVLGHHLHTPPVRPSERAGRPLPEDLEGLILRCLRKDPSERPQSARALRRALEACEDMGAWTEEHALEWWQQHGPSLRADDDEASFSERTLAVAEGLR